MGADVQNTQWGIRLHDLKFFGIFVEKVAMREQEIHSHGLRAAPMRQCGGWAAPAVSTGHGLQLHQVPSCLRIENRWADVATGLFQTLDLSPQCFGLALLLFTVSRGRDLPL